MAIFNTRHRHQLCLIFHLSHLKLLRNVQFSVLENCALCCLLLLLLFLNTHWNICRYLSAVHGSSWTSFLWPASTEKWILIKCFPMHHSHFCRSPGQGRKYSYVRKSNRTAANATLCEEKRLTNDCFLANSSAGVYTENKLLKKESFF